VIQRGFFRVFVAATEDEKRVLEALALFVPLESILINSAKGHFGNEIKILEANLKNRECLAFFHVLKEQLPSEERLKLRREAPERIDGKSCFHLRLDKQAAYKGFVRLTNAKDAIDISIHIGSFPARREEAVRIVGELI
jgi:RNA binding exosome subunit